MGPKPKRPPAPVLRRAPWLSEDEMEGMAYINGRWVRIHNSLPARLSSVDASPAHRRNMNKRRSRSMDNISSGPKRLNNKDQRVKVDRAAIKSLQEEYRKSKFTNTKKVDKHEKEDVKKTRPKRQISFQRLNCNDCVKCLKYTTISYALVIGILGLLLLSAGGWLLLGLSHVTIRVPMFGDVMEFVAYVMMGFGGALVLMGILGGVGAKRENQCMLTTFSVLLATTLFMELGCGTWIYRLFGDIEGLVTGGGLTGVSLTAIGLFLSTCMCCYVRKGSPRHLASVV